MSNPVASWAVGLVTGLVFGARIGWIWAKPRDRDPDYRRSFNHENTNQLKHQLLLKAKADLIREVINQALKDTAFVHWRVTDTGEQIVRVGDLLRWAEQAANNMEKTDDN